MNFIEINNTKKKIEICTYILQNLRSHLAFCNLPSALYIHNDISQLQSLLRGSISAPRIQKMTCRMQRELQDAERRLPRAECKRMETAKYSMSWKMEG